MNQSHSERSRYGDQSYHIDVVQAKLVVRWFPSHDCASHCFRLTIWMNPQRTFEPEPVRTIILFIAIKTFFSIDSEIGIRIGYVNDLSSPDEGVLLRIADLARAICIDSSLDVGLLLRILRAFQALEQGIDAVRHSSVSLFSQPSSVSKCLVA